MTYVTKHIDWLSFSIPEVSHPSVAFPLFLWTFTGRGLHGYKSRYMDRRTQAVCETDGPTSEAKTLFRFSGDTLNALRQETGMVDDGLCAHVVRLHGSPSRIDLTLNIHDGKLTPRHLYDAYKVGRLTARSKRGRFIEGINDDVSGDTFYLGSPKSDRQFRAYNKAAELGIVDGSAWLRLELELRNLRAQGALASCASNGTPATVTGHVADFLAWNNDEFRQALDGPSALPLDIPRKQTNRQRWLLGQVAQALAKEICMDEDFALKFWSSVGMEVADIKLAR